MLQTVWGWQPALYLFLGGMGAGCFIMAAILYLRNQAQHRLIVCVAMWAAVVCLVGGLLLLVAELIFPLRGVMMWQSFDNFTSWMTYGAWGAFGAIVTFGLSAVLAIDPLMELIERRWELFAKIRPMVRRVLAVIGIALGAFVAFYTGTLLMTSYGVPIWDTILLPCLFTVSALDTGVTLVEVIAVALRRRDQLHHWAALLMERTVVSLVILECLVFVAFFAVMFASNTASEFGRVAVLSADNLLTGILAPYFWIMVVAIGLILPLTMAATGLILSRRHAKGSDETKGETAENGKQKRAPRFSPAFAVMLIGAVGAMIGGCELRFLMLAAGIHADLVVEAAQKLIG